MTTVIIPANNEEASIINCLNPFARNGSLPTGLQVIVVCNGCADNTATLVKSVHSNIDCIETDIPSKTNALNLGDSLADFYPRIYLDADVVLTLDAVNAMVDTLNTERVLATSVEPKTDLSGSSWFVRAFYDIWLKLPYFKEGMIGSGVYALSEQGRARFSKFPDLIADDGYIRCLFNEQERTVTKGFYSTVKAPKDLMSLIKIKTRSRLGRYELRDKFPELLSNETKRYMNAFLPMIFNIKLWPKILVYLGVNIISRIRANFQYKTKKIIWERDDSSRS
ncbi:glycosyltransferase [Methylobacter sp.]|uniref:glycosyltransferase n=1 Tax=Methylobacter sp. TaxID=2051955 RepID=UPI003DA2B341